MSNAQSSPLSSSYMPNNRSIAAPRIIAKAVETTTVEAASLLEVELCFGELEGEVEEEEEELWLES